MACRGLILDDLGGIVARPFLKFFNFGEGGAGIPVVPLAVQQASGGGGKGGSGGSGGGGGEFIAYDKLDGSLGITYFYGGKAYIATRGSFVSEQAQVATRMLNELYPDAVESMVKWAGKYTFLFGMCLVGFFFGCFGWLWLCACCWGRTMTTDSLTG